MIDRVVAVVGRAVITQRQLESETCLLLAQRAGPDAAKITPDLPLLRRMLDFVVAQELMAQEARRGHGLSADEADVDARAARLRGRFQEPKGYSDFLDECGLREEDVRTIFRREFLVEQLLPRVFASSSLVTESEVREYLSQHPEWRPDLPAPERHVAGRVRLEQLKREVEAGAYLAELRRKLEVRVVPPEFEGPLAEPRSLPLVSP